MQSVPLILKCPLEYRDRGGGDTTWVEQQGRTNSTGGTLGKRACSSFFVQQTTQDSDVWHIYNIINGAQRQKKLIWA